MRTLMAVEFYKLKRMKMVWIAMLIPLLAGMNTALQDAYLQDPAVIKYPQLNYMGLMASISAIRTMAAVIIMAVAYMASQDFDERTVQNILSAGINRRHYYFSRLLTQFLFAFAVYGGTTLLFVLCRLYRQWEQGVFGEGLPVGEFSVTFLIFYLQFCAYCSISNMLSIFIKKQSTCVLAAFVWLIAEILSPMLQAMIFSEDSAFTWFVPLIALEGSVDFIEKGAIFSFSYLRCGLSALVIILATSAVGYWKFCYTDQYIAEKEE